MLTTQTEIYNSFQGNFGLMDNLMYTGMLNQKHQPTLLKVYIVRNMQKSLMGLREFFCVIQYYYCNVMVILAYVSSSNLWFSNN